MPKKPEAETKAPTKAEEFAAFIEGLAQNQTISTDVAAIIKAQIVARLTPKEG